jgi:hypothetical protein
MSSCGNRLFLRLNQREIPHFVLKDKTDYSFRGLLSLLVLLAVAAKVLRPTPPG